MEDEVLLETASRCEVLNFQVSTTDHLKISDYVNYVRNGMLWSFREKIWT